ncbi:MAG: lamin tail domain-containing protein [Candidatus Krumholzibacteriota bacterium]|nr:lamin tail domain-containing protein [Candidatus Krumholzibacteriota bacterium]
MRKVFRFLIHVTFLIIVLLAAAATAGADVLINEIMADPARDWDGDGEYNYRDDEWIEILNTGPSIVDLSDYLLSDGESEPVWRFGFAGTLMPGATLVVYGSDSRAWEESNGQPVYGLSLNNTGDQVSLYKVEGGDTVLLEDVLFSDKTAEDDRSLGRSIMEPGKWELFDAFNPCPLNCDPAGNGCAPTPGFSNGCTTAAGDDSWGSIKRKYFEQDGEVNSE